MAVAPLDPFELPDWLGTEHVSWCADTALSDAPRVAGTLRARSGEQQLDLLAVDAVYPRQVCPDRERHDAHQAWQFGQVLIAFFDGRVTAAVPGVRFDANRACEAIGRFAKAVGASAGNVTVSIQL